MGNKIGNVNYSDPRAVQVAGKYIDGGDPEDKTPHSAVKGYLVVLTDTMTDANVLIDNWHRIVAAVNDRVEQLLTEANGDG